MLLWCWDRSASVVPNVACILGERSLCADQNNTVGKALVSAEAVAGNVNVAQWLVDMVEVKCTATTIEPVILYMCVTCG